MPDLNSQENSDSQRATPTESFTANKLAPIRKKTRPTATAHKSLNNLNLCRPDLAVTTEIRTFAPVNETSRDGAVVARWAHNPKVGGSSPPPATKKANGFRNHTGGRFCLIINFKKRGVVWMLAGNLLNLHYEQRGTQRK